MEEKRYGILDSLINTIKTYIQHGREEDIEEDDKLNSKARKLLDELNNRRDAFAKRLLETLNGGGMASTVLEKSANNNKRKIVGSKKIKLNRTVSNKTVDEKGKEEMEI